MTDKPAPPQSPGREATIRAIQLSYARNDLEPTSETTLALYREDAEHAADAILAVQSPVLPPSGVGWRCFFCDEIFTDAKTASDHFGDTICADPLCKVAQIDGGIAQTIAKLAEQLNRFQIEDNTSFREFYALGADHHAALIQEEKKGYDRGLADGRALSASVGGEADTSWSRIDKELSAYVETVRKDLIERCAQEALRRDTHALFCMSDPTAIRSDIADRIRALAPTPARAQQRKKQNNTPL